MDLGLSGRVHVVTGGSRGLGLATARVLLAEGARVLLAGRDEASLDRAASALGEHRGPGAADRVATCVADLAHEDTAERLVVAAHDRWGALHGALVSVGGPPAGSVLEVSDEQWRAAFESVFLGAVRLGRVLGRALTRPADLSAPPADTDEQGGSLAFVLSTSVRTPVPGLAISNGLRPGLGMVVTMLADELGPDGVRVTGLLPGRVDTDRVRALDAASDDPAETRRRHEAGIPLGRYGRPEEFGRVAAFLLSPAASYVSGSLVTVDGGQTRAL